MSKIDKGGLYLIMNEGTSPVFVPSRTGGFMMPPSADGDPTVRQLYFSEIIEINSMCDLFRHGHLFFEKEYEEAIYEELRISNWKEILHNSDIEEILLNPTKDGLQRILDIKSPTYFDRVRGVYVGLKNSGANLTRNVIDLMEQRSIEVSRGIMTTKISLQPKNNQDNVSNEALEAMQQKIAAMEEKLNSVQSKSDESEHVAKAPAEKKTTAKKTTSARTTTKKK